MFMVITDGGKKNPSKSPQIKCRGVFTCLLDNGPAEEEYLYTVKLSKFVISKKIKPDNAQNNTIKSTLWCSNLPPPFTAAPDKQFI